MLKVSLPNLDLVDVPAYYYAFFRCHMMQPEFRKALSLSRRAWNDATKVKPGARSPICPKRNGGTCRCFRRGNCSMPSRTGSTNACLSSRWPSSFRSRGGCYGRSSGSRQLRDAT